MPKRWKFFYFKLLQTVIDKNKEISPGLANLCADSSCGFRFLVEVGCWPLVSDLTDVVGCWASLSDFIDVVDCWDPVSDLIDEVDSFRFGAVFLTAEAGVAGVVAVRLELFKAGVSARLSVRASSFTGFFAAQPVAIF